MRVRDLLLTSPRSSPSHDWLQWAESQGNDVAGAIERAGFDWMLRGALLGGLVLASHHSGLAAWFRDEFSRAVLKDKRRLDGDEQAGASTPSEIELALARYPREMVAEAVVALS